MSALRILAGCSNGATFDALIRNGVDKRELVDLTARGLISNQQIATLAGDRKLAVLWFRITKAGREALGQVYQ